MSPWFACCAASGASCKVDDGGRYAAGAGGGGFRSVFLASLDDEQSRLTKDFTCATEVRLDGIDLEDGLWAQKKWLVLKRLA